LEAVNLQISGEETKLLLKHLHLQEII